jgi:heat shock protein HslJ
LLLLCGVADADVLRYRGDYTYGHEVNTFCPAINSQCYWLGGDTDQRVRNELMASAATNTSKPYQPLCVVLEGEIDRDSPRTGFAADYDGLFTATRLFGTCEETEIVTHGDLQHHRWLLESIDGEVLDTAALEDRIPELEIGEQMHVSGNSGCNRFSGQATLRDTSIDFGNMISTAMSCLPAQNELEATVLRVLGSSPTVALDEDSNLTLTSADATLRYRLRDWVD